MLPCILNGKEKEHAIIQQREDAGEIDYITADYQRAELIAGLSEERLYSGFLEIAKPLQHIKETIETLHSSDIKCLLITVGPVQVAKVVASIWGFDGYYGSNYEVIDGLFSGKIIEYIKAENKVHCLKDFCSKNGIIAADCVAVGDESTDIPVFEYCGKSIAINAASERVKKMATHAVYTESLLDILLYILVHS